MNQTRSILLFCLIVLLSHGNMIATHIVGADLTYTCVNSASNQYEISLTMYRDCTPASQAQFDNDITLYIFNGNNSVLYTTRVVQKPFLTPEIIAADWDVCTGQVYSLCVEYGTYTTTITLPPRAGGYDIGWSRCCRNNSVTNIVSGPGPGSQGITVLAHVPSIDVMGCNSMPTFNRLAPLFLCAGQPFNFDHSATDVDGDSLVYLISNPYGGLNTAGLGTSSQAPTVGIGNPLGSPPYQNVQYLGGYNYLDPFGTGNFSIDPLSGFLTLTPTQNGLFVFAISVLEYRNGVFMSENKRDFQINVVTCQPQSTPPVIGSNLSPVPTHSNDTIYIQPEEAFCYDIAAGDPMANDTVVLFEVSATFGIGGTLPPPYATLNYTGTNPALGQVCWQPGCDYAGLTLPIIVGGRDTTDCAGYNIVFDTVIVVIGGATPPTFSAGPGATIDVGETHCFSFQGMDVDPKNGIVVTPISGPFVGLGGTATISSMGHNPINGQVCWTPGCDDAGQTFAFTIQGTDTNYCDVSFPQRRTINITVNPLPTVSAPDTVEGCFGSVVTIPTSTSAPMSAYNWSPPNGLDNPSSANPSLTVFTPRDFIVTFTDTFGCQQFDTTHVKPLPLPTIVLSPDPTICSGDSTRLNAQGGVAYQWSPSTGLDQNNIPNPWANPTTTTTYQVIVTDIMGCKDTATVTVSVNPLPIVDAGNDTVKCGNNGIMLTATGGIGYTWSPTTGLSNPNSATPVANPDSSTTYVVTAIDANGCENTDSVFVRAFYANAGPDVQICIGDTTQIFASGGVAYQWDPSPTLINGNISSPTVFPLDTTDYYVLVTDISGCTDRDTMTLIVNPLPTTSVTNPDPYVCSGGATILTATGGMFYIWDTDSTLDSLNVAEPVARPINLGPNIIDSVWYFVTVIDSNGCVNRDSIGLEVRTRPDITVSQDTFVCPGDTVPISLVGGFGVIDSFWRPDPTLLDPLAANTVVFPSVSTYYYGVVVATWGCDNTDSVFVYVIDPDAGPDTTTCYLDSIMLQGSGGVSYQWSPSTGLSNPNIANPMASPINTTTYILTVTDSVGCVDTDTMTLTVLDLPPADAGPDEAICIGDSVQLQASGGIIYAWTPNIALSNDSIPNPIAKPDITVGYIVTVTDPNGCINTDSMILSVNNLPNIDAGRDTTICRKQPATLRATGGATYLWSPPDGLSDIAVASPLASPDSSLMYFVQGTDQNGCINYDSVTVMVIQLPEAIGSPDDTICKFQLSELSVAGTGSRYLWSTGETTLSITVDPKVPTTYWVVPYGDEGCPGDTTYINVFVEVNLPRARFDLDPTEGFYFLDVQFANISQNATRYVWDFGDGGMSMEENPLYTFKTPGLWPVKLVADNEIGCPDSMTFEFVKVLEEEIFFPNAFTPNGDSKNDEFFIPNGGIERLEIRIFSRWGKEVFYSVDPTFRWDGTYQGQPVQEGVYVYRVTGTTFGGQTIERAGSITIIR